MHAATWNLRTLPLIFVAACFILALSCSLSSAQKIIFSSPGGTQLGTHRIAEGTAEAYTSLPSIIYQVRSFSHRPSDNSVIGSISRRFFTPDSPTSFISKVDTVTGNFIGMMQTIDTVTFEEVALQSIAVDPSTNGVFGVSRDGYLYTADVETGSVFQINTEPSLVTGGLAFSPNGVLHGADNLGRFYSIDLSTGTESLVVDSFPLGNTGFSFGNGAADATFASNDKYYVATIQRIYELNIETEEWRISADNDTGQVYQALAAPPGVDAFNPHPPCEIVRSGGGSSSLALGITPDIAFYCVRPPTAPTEQDSQSDSRAWVALESSDTLEFASDSDVLFTEFGTSALGSSSISGDSNSVALLAIIDELNGEALLLPGQVHAFPTPVSKFRVVGLSSQAIQSSSGDVPVLLGFNSTGLAEFTVQAINVPEPTGVNVVLTLAVLLYLRRKTIP